MRRSVVLGLLCTLILVLIVGGVAARWQRMTADQAIKQADKAQFDANIKDATAVQLGVLSDLQRTHSRLYGGIIDLGQKPLDEMVADAIDQGHLTTGRMVTGTRYIEEVSLKTFVGVLTEKSDAIVRGSVKSSVSQLTDDRRFLFTDYEIAVSDVIKGSDGLLAGNTITITRPGGTVLLKGVLVTASIEGFDRLSKDGQEVLLFLRRVPNSPSFQATGSIGTFQLNAGKIMAIGGPIPSGILDNPSAFLEAVRTASSK